MFCAHQSCRATRRGRRKMAQNSLREPFGKLVCQCRADNPFRTLSESLLERLWGGPGTLLDGSWALLARLGRPKIGLGASCGCPKTVPSASGRIPEKTLGAQTGPRSIFLRFGMDFRRFSKDFSSIFARAACDEGTKQNLKKESCVLTARFGPCVTQSLRTARTCFEMACERYMFSLFSLRTHKCT